MSAQPRNIEQDKKKVQDDKDFTSARMSDVTRFIGFGLSALTWALLTSSSVFAQEMIQAFKWQILFSSLAGCLAIFFDYLQYFFGYRASEEAYQNIRRYELKILMKSGEQDDLKVFNVKSFNYQARRIFFAAKHICIFIGMIVFISVLLRSMFQ